MSKTKAMVLASSQNWYHFKTFNLITVHGTPIPHRSEENIFLSFPNNIPGSYIFIFLCMHMHIIPKLCMCKLRPRHVWSWPDSGPIRSGRSWSLTFSEHVRSRAFTHYHIDIHKELLVRNHERVCSPKVKPPKRPVMISPESGHDHAW